jgi:hemolysin III
VLITTSAQNAGWMVTVFELRDFVSSSSHLATAVWAVFATLLMLRLTPKEGSRHLAVSIYGLSMILLFLASGTFHGLHYSNPEEMRFFQKIDQSAVYILIAGTNTPLMTILLQGRLRKWCLRFVWAIAFTGAASLWLLPKPPHPLVVSLYVGLGYLGTVPIFHYYRAVGWRAMNWLWIGAGFYTLGAVCELTQWPVIIPGWVQSHEVLHLCDSAACFAFFIFIIRHVINFSVPYSSKRPQSVTSEMESAPELMGSTSHGELRVPVGQRSGVVQH